MNSISNSSLEDIALQQQRVQSHQEAAARTHPCASDPHVGRTVAARVKANAKLVSARLFTKNDCCGGTDGVRSGPFSTLNCGPRCIVRTLMRSQSSPGPGPTRWVQEWSRKNGPRPVQHLRNPLWRLNLLPFGGQQLHFDHPESNRFCRNLLTMEGKTRRATIDHDPLIQLLSPPHLTERSTRLSVGCCLHPATVYDYVTTIIQLLQSGGGTRAISALQWLGSSTASHRRVSCCATRRGVSDLLLTSSHEDLRSC